MSAPDQLFLAFQETVAGRYSIDRELGRGGMGVVYLAREVHLDRPVAIKLLPPERAADRTLRDRFLREARLAAKLSHPNIIPIHSVEDAGGFVFFVMAFIDGETLADRVRSRGPLPSADGARMLREVAWALAYAHGQGLIHRDVKPDNILLEHGSGRVLVADFGIAAAHDDASDGIAGTPEFMSPEQALGTQLDARSDLYGLGATAFFAFSGKFPFEGKTGTEVLAKQVTQPAPPLSSLGLSVPRKLAALIDRCLAKSPDQRPESAQVLAEQLGVALEQKRELPIALRTFVKRSGRLDGPATLLFGGFMTVGLTITGLMSAYMDDRTGPLIAFSSMVAFALAAPFGALVDAARHLLQQGFSHSDIGPAFDSVLDQAREELALERAQRVASLERLLIRTALVSLPVAAIAPIASIYREVGDVLFRFLGGPLSILVSNLSIAAMPITFFSGLGYLVLRARHTEPESEFWSGLWKGRIGKLAFAVAKRLMKGRIGSAYTHRATELSLGMAAEQLYESLPSEARKQLAHLPDTLRSLQNAAQELRRRHESIVEALAESGEVAASAEYADVRATRDALHAKMSETVGALETIRLNLLRLHAGSVSAASVTTQLGLAADVADEVERLIAAQGEVERTLKFPRTPATTPV